MRIVFCGGAEFSVPSLRACNARHQIAAVVTHPDKRGDRGRAAPRPVADAALALGLLVLQPPRIRHPESVREVLELAADALVVVAYGQIIPLGLLDGHRHGGVNVHASLLPRWRGASPIAHAILAGDAETGVCIMQMDAGLDTGPVYATRRLAITERETTPQLTGRLAIAGAEELVAVLASIDRHQTTAKPQPSDGVTMAPRLQREDGTVDWALHGAEQVDRMLRGLAPWPGVSAPLAGVDVIIASGEARSGEGGSPGEILATGTDHADVGTREGVFRIFTVTPPGKRGMSAAAFLRGRRVAPADR